MADVYDGVLRTIMHDCKSFILPLLNEVFGEDYTGDEEIVFHPNEHFLDTQDAPDVKRITDTALTVKGIVAKNYHLECESSKYNSRILIRLFEYDAQIALDDYSETINDRLKVRFPNTTVIYLRVTSRTPNMMTVDIETPGGAVSYPIPVVKLSDYTIDDIFERRLYILIPFYIFNYEREFKKNKDNKTYIRNLQVMYNGIMDRLEQLVDINLITAFDKRTIIELSKDAAEELTKKYSSIQKGVVETMSGALIETEARRILNQGISQGISQGIDERNYEIAERMIIGSEPLSKIVEYTQLSMDSIKEIAEKLGKAFE